MRYERHSQIFNSDELRYYPCTVIGAGAIGSNLAQQLARIGVPSITVYDFDNVEEVNLGAQGYGENSLGKNKAEVTAVICRNINSNIYLYPSRKWDAYSALDTVVFSCVDSMETRKTIFECCKKKDRVLIDGRMSSEIARVICAWDKESYDYYETTLYSDEEAVQESCTTRSTCYCSNIAAGLMLAQFSKILRKFDHIDRDIIFSIAGMELSRK